MDRRIIVVVALALAVIAGASIAFFMTGTKPPSPQASAPATPASPAPSSPVATVEVPGVVPERAAPAPRRRAAPKPESAPAAEAPAPVETAPTNKDDGFSAPLLDLAAFQVDYLEKNLRLTLRGGKRFDFTDPEGNADHLFVFHRDVEKARERLKKGDRPAQNEW